MRTVEGILVDCAKLRGTELLMNRTLQEFNWFVQSAIFGSNSSDKETSEVYLNYHNRLSGVGCELLWWASLFYEYCENKYGVKTLRDLEKRCKE